MAKPDVGFINELIFGSLFHNKMKVNGLVENKSANWKVIAGEDEWIGTKMSFEILVNNSLTY